MSALPKTHYTIEEYIELLKNSDERFEYFDGAVMSRSKSDQNQQPTSSR